MLFILRVLSPSRLGKPAGEPAQHAVCSLASPKHASHRCLHDKHPSPPRLGWLPVCSAPALSAVPERSRGLCPRLSLEGSRHCPPPRDVGFPSRESPGCLRGCREGPGWHQSVVGPAQTSAVRCKLKRQHCPKVC